MKLMRLGLGIFVVGCSGQEKSSAQEAKRPADFSIQIGVESVTILDGEPSTPYTLYNAEQEPLVTLISR